MKRFALGLLVALSVIALAQERPVVEQPAAPSSQQYNIVIRIVNGVAEFLRLEKVTTAPGPGGGETGPGSGETNPGSGETNPGGGETNPGGGETEPGPGEDPSDPNPSPGCDITIGPPAANLYALLASTNLKPGIQVCLRGGVYAAEVSKPFVVRAHGLQQSPITIRSAPGEAAILDGGDISPTANYTTKVGPANTYTLVVRGDHVWIRDLEIMSSSKETRQDSLNPIDGRAPLLARGRGVILTGKGDKLINSYVHDVAASCVFIPGNPLVDAAGAELYGNVFANCGWRYHPDAKGAQPDRGGGHGLYLDGNLATNPVKLVQDNFLGPVFGDFAFQLTGGSNNFMIAGNIIARRALGGSGTGLTVRDNAFWKVGIQPQQTSLINNLGISASGATAVPADQVIVRRNIYDPNRALIAIYNAKQQLDHVRVDLASLNWPADSEVEVRNAFDYGSDRESLKLNGTALSLEMDRHTVSTPLGWNAPLIPNPYPQFGAFVVVRK